MSVTKPQLRALIDATVVERNNIRRDLKAKADQRDALNVEVAALEAKLNEVELTAKSLQSAMKILFRDAT